MPTAAEAVPDQSEAAIQAPTGTNAYAADDVSVASASDRGQLLLYQLRSQHGLSEQATQHPKQVRQHPDQLTWHPDHCRRPAASEAAAASAPAASESSQQGKCCSPDGTFVGRAAARPTSSVKQELPRGYENSCIHTFHLLAPVNRHAMVVMTVSLGTNNSAA